MTHEQRKPTARAWAWLLMLLGLRQMHGGPQFGANVTCHVTALWRCTESNATGSGPWISVDFGCPGLLKRIGHLQDGEENDRLVDSIHHP